MSKPFNDYLHHLIEQQKLKVADLANAIHISKDALYRKLRGETDFIFAEVLALQAILGFSLDAFATKPNPNKITLDIKRFQIKDTPVATVSSYVSELLADLSKLNAVSKPHLYYAAKDLPLFCFFSSHILTSFKLYFWYMTLFDTEKPKKYIPNWLPDDTLKNAATLHSMYENIDSTEIWNQETMSSTLDQILYCWESGLINAIDAKAILKALDTFTDTLDHYATTKSKKNKTSFTLYFNKILILDNSVLFKIGLHNLFYLPLRTLNFLTSSDPHFTGDMEAWLHNQIKKSTLISGEAEKEGMKFIGHYKKMISAMMRKVELED